MAANDKADEVASSIQNRCTTAPVVVTVSRMRV